MKALTILIFVILVSLQATAQENQDKIFLQAKIQKAKDMKGGGIALTAVGGILCFSGLITMARSLDVWDSEQNDKYKTGETLFGVGGICLGGGIPLLIVGAKNERKYKRALQTLSVQLNANSQSKGLTFTYRF